jgi:AcrR family transcriptional regulator
MPPSRKPRADGETHPRSNRPRSRLARTLDGLEGLSIGNLADALDMSHSCIYAHFGSKQELQLATVDEARRIFDAEARSIEPLHPIMSWDGGPAGPAVQHQLRPVAGGIWR